jgi:hypothetical protein
MPLRSARVTAGFWRTAHCLHKYNFQLQAFIEQSAGSIGSAMCSYWNCESIGAALAEFIFVGPPGYGSQRAA